MNATTSEEPQVDQGLFRSVMSQFATGVVVITGRDNDGAPRGMTAQSFLSLSLDPPLVMVCPARSSSSWPQIGPHGSFAINVLGAHQADISTRFATRGADKFANTAWHEGDLGLPLIGGAIAHIECDLEAVYPGGDHYIVVGRVRSLHSTLDDETDAAPLLFYRSSYRTLGEHPYPRV